VLEICDRFSFSSTKYKFEAIEVTKCKIKLKDYESIRNLYVSTNSVDDIANSHELKKHIQIRCRELVNEYLSKNNIELKDILQPDVLVNYNKKIDELTNMGLFNKSDVEINYKELDKKKAVVDSEFKINPLKENYVKKELIKDINSEYFKITPEITQGV
jgi:hypothetical protein